MENGLKIISTGKITPYKPSNLQLKEGDEVLIDVLGCQEKGIICELGGSDTDVEQNNQEIEPPEIIRKLNETDIKRYDGLKNQASGYITECMQRIVAHNLDMTILDAELSFDEKKLTFFFSAPGRVDFRSLVSDLASTFKKLIRLQQVGARDQARFLDGHGRCGQRYCCRSFLTGNLDEVTLEMARVQQLSHMGANRITGSCGKLECCLRYEIKPYQENLKNLPKIGDEVKIKEGKGVVVDLNILLNKVLVLLEEGNRVEVDWLK